MEQMNKNTIVIQTKFLGVKKNKFLAKILICQVLSPLHQLNLESSNKKDLKRSWIGCKIQEKGRDLDRILDPFFHKRYASDLSSK